MHIYALFIYVWFSILFHIFSKNKPGCTFKFLNNWIIKIVAVFLFQVLKSGSWPWVVSSSFSFMWVSDGILSIFCKRHECRWTKGNMLLASLGALIPFYHPHHQCPPYIPWVFLSTRTEPISMLVLETMLPHSMIYPFHRILYLCQGLHDIIRSPGAI